MKKPYRSKDFNDERKWKYKSLLDDVTKVGIHKAIGYVVIKNDNELNSLKKTCGKHLTYYKSWGGNYSAPTFWVGDEKMIQAIIDSNKELLIKNSWSLEASEVFYRICIEDVPHEKNSELYHFITDLFNSWCLWCDKFKWVNGKPERFQPSE